MSLKLLKEYQVYKMNMENFSIHEREIIKESFKLELIQNNNDSKYD